MEFCTETGWHRSNTISSSEMSYNVSDRVICTLTLPKISLINVILQDPITGEFSWITVPFE
jgi:hypothetical protein